MTARESMINIANQITVSRIFLAFLSIGFLLTDTLWGLIASLVIFILASFTDFLDGFLARRKNIISDFGKIMDPIADKVLIVGMFLALVSMDVVNLWMVIVIILREFLITSLRLYALSKGKVLSAQKFGKHKTVSQIVGIGLILFLMILERNATLSVGVVHRVIFFVLWWIVFITIFSGMVYFWSNRKLIKTF